MESPQPKPRKPLQRGKGGFVKFTKVPVVDFEKLTPTARKLFSKCPKPAP
jgi:hypothetical protein